MTTKFKKSLAAMLAFAMLCMSACGGKGDSSSSADSVVDNAGGNDTAQELYISDTFSYSQVSMGGGGFVTGVFSTCEEGVYYARTDVGGAYRWDDSEGKWIALCAFVDENEVGYLGIDGMAIDPTNAGKIVLAAGTEYFNGGQTAMLVSDDYGVTFDIVPVTDMIRVHGNGMGRGNGERVAFDPTNTNKIFVGGRTGGLIRSDDGGKTFTKVESFPVDQTANGVGINSILVAENGDIYCAVSQAKDENVYVSKDDGATWNVVSALSNRFMVQRMRFDSNGDIIVTLGGSEGPHGGDHDGVILRYDPDSDTAEDISMNPNKCGDCIAHPENPDWLLACSEDYWVAQPHNAWGDYFIISKDGGETWTNINDKMTVTNGGVDWVSHAAMHWSSCLMIDPFNPDTVMTVSGNGIWRCDNIWDENPEFYFFSNGVEETVPFDVVSVPNGPLLTNIGDYDGFIQPDAFTFGKAYSPQLGSASSSAVAYQDTQIMLRVANSSQPYLSTDGGNTWKPTSASTGASGGVVGLSANGDRLFWSPSSDMSVYYSEDLGESWTKAEGIYGPAYVKGDAFDNNVVYAATAGRFCMSTDGGKTFTRTLESMGGNIRFAVDVNNAGTVYYIGNTLMKSVDFGKTFETVGTLSRVEAMGIGKGKDDMTPAIYIYGQPTADDVKGVWWSNDGGNTWARVDDDLHQYGGTGNGGMVAGDWNTYGRCYMSTVGMGVACFDLIDKN